MLTKRLQYLLHILGQIGVKAYFFLGRWVLKPKCFRMQSLSAQISNEFVKHHLPASGIGPESHRSTPIGGISKHMIPNMRQMHTYLMGSTGFQAYLKQTQIIKILEHFIMSNCMLTSTLR